MGENAYIKSMLGILDGLYWGIENKIEDRNDREKEYGISSISAMIGNNQVAKMIDVYGWHFDSFSKIITTVLKDELISIRKTKEGKHYLLYGNEEET